MSSDFCIKCDNALAVYCGKCVDAEREELNRLRRLVPTGTYTLNVAHEEEIQRLKDAGEVLIRSLERMTKERDEARDLLRAVAAACRGLGPRTDAVMAVVGNALAELDEERENVKTLTMHVETLREAWRSASDEVARLRAENGEAGP